MTDYTARERQARFAARVREQGLVKICEWIPIGCRDTFKAFAAELKGDEPEPTPEPSQPPDDLSDKVRQAHGWGWAPAAIAAYLGTTAEHVERILKE
jgi:hypothetical protein